jgi:hypothetical protein
MAMEIDAVTAERALVHRIRTEGIQAAYEAALAVCRDVKAPAPARATAAGLLFRAAGLFDRPGEDDAPEPHAMTPEELGSEIARIRRRLTAGTPTGDPGEAAPETGMFG